MLARMATATPSSAEQPWPLGDLLRATRKRRKMSLEAVAERTGFSKGLVHMIERGRRSDGRAYRPTAADVITMAHAVHADPVEALEAAGYDPSVDAPDLAAGPNLTIDQLAEKIRHLTASQRAALVAMVDSMLEPTMPPSQHGILFEGEVVEDIPAEPPAVQRGGKSSNRA